ncbi:Protein T06A4.1 a [Aphelenchoides avenae]|nr:Protein T06A4.1 a [Aphelenchus avenae]
MRISLLPIVNETSPISDTHPAASHGSVSHNRMAIACHNVILGTVVIILIGVIAVQQGRIAQLQSSLTSRRFRRSTYSEPDDTLYFPLYTQLSVGGTFIVNHDRTINIQSKAVDRICAERAFSSKQTRAEDENRTKKVLLKPSKDRTNLRKSMKHKVCPSIRSLGIPHVVGSRPYNVGSAMRFGHVWALTEYESGYLAFVYNRSSNTSSAAPGRLPYRLDYPTSIHTLTEPFSGTHLAIRHDANDVGNLTLYYHIDSTDRIVALNLNTGIQISRRINDMLKEPLYRGNPSFIDFEADLHALWIVYKRDSGAALIVKKLSLSSLKTLAAWNVPINDTAGLSDTFVACGILYGVVGNGVNSSTDRPLYHIRPIFNFHSGIVVPNTTMRSKPPPAPPIDVTGRLQVLGQPALQKCRRPVVTRFFPTPPSGMHCANDEGAEKFKRVCGGRPLSFKSRKQQDDEEKQSFRNYKLLRIMARSEETLDYLRMLYEQERPYELDFWQPPTHIGAAVDLSVSPEDAEFFTADLDQRQVDYVVTINDLEQAINDERVYPAQSEFYEDRFRLDKYNTFEQIEDYLYKIRDENPEAVTLIDIGRTHENRSLLVVKISPPANNSQSVKRRHAFWIDAGIHAREWIAPATALIFIDKLLNGHIGNDPEIMDISRHIDWYVMPVMNPDGYVYSHRKDLNRNFDWFWSTSGASSDPCHETYQGPRAFSEPESRAVKDFLEKNPVKGFVTMHSYSQLWLVPFGHKKKTYPNDYKNKLRPLALKATKALNKLYGTKYAVGTGADLMYEASGASHDFAKGTLHIPYAYLIELRPQNTMFSNGFLLNEREIWPTGQETWEAIKVVANQLVSEFAETSTSGVVAQTMVPVTPTTTVTTTTEPSTAEPTASSTAEVASTTEPETPPPYTGTVAPYLTAVPTLPAVTEGPTTHDEEETTTPPPQRIIQCRDYGSYCKWWRIHSLCAMERVRKLCALSCLPECQI